MPKNNLTESEVISQPQEQPTETAEQTAPQSEAVSSDQEQEQRPAFYTVDIEKPFFSQVDGKRLSRTIRQQFGPRAFAQFKAQAARLGYTITIVSGPTDE
jgi:hypothetical protein